MFIVKVRLRVTEREFAPKISAQILDVNCVFSVVSTDTIAREFTNETEAMSTCHSHHNTYRGLYDLLLSVVY